MNPPTDQPEDEKPNNLCAELTHLREVLASSNRSREEWREKLFGPDGKSGLVAEAEGLRAQVAELLYALEEVQQNSSLEGFPEDAPDQVATIRGIVDRVLSKTSAQFEGMTCVKADELEQLKMENEYVIGLLKDARCPDCDGSGHIVRQVSETEQVEQQCEWCYHCDAALASTPKEEKA